MPLPFNKQVSSLELSKKLKELGVVQGSLFYWCNMVQDYTDILRSLETDWHLIYGHGGWTSECLISAFTASELADMLKDQKIRIFRYMDCWVCETYIELPTEDAQERFVSNCENLPDALAKCLIHLIEHNIVKL
jgi:hypothetical protein